MTFFNMCCKTQQLVGLGLIKVYVYFFGNHVYVSYVTSTIICYRKMLLTSAAQAAVDLLYACFQNIAVDSLAFKLKNINVLSS